MNPNLIAAKVLSFLHLVAIVFLLFGWAFPEPFPVILLWATPLTILQWWVFSNQCLLTRWQRYFEGHDQPTRPEDGYIYQLLLKLSGKQPSPTLLNLVNYGLLIASWLINFAVNDLGPSSAL